MSSYVSNLLEVITIWGNEFAKRNGTGNKLLGIKMQYNPSGMPHDPPLSFRVTNVHYTDKGTGSDLPGFVVTDSEINDTELQQNSVFKRTESTTSTFTWTMKEAISVGISLEFDVGVPPIASAKTTISAKISVSSTQSSTKTETQSWEIDRNVAVPPRTRVDMKWSIIKKKIQANFECDVVITKYVLVTFEHPVNPDRGTIWSASWYMPIEWIFKSMDDMRVKYPPQYTWTPGSVIYTATGICSAALGLTTTFDLKQTPLNGSRAQPHGYTQQAVPVEQPLKAKHSKL